MAIYRGPGGAGNATDDATITEVTGLVAQAASSATSAASSASSATTSATSAASSASNAASSASTAATNASNAASSASSAASSASSASSSASAASTSATNAASSASAASTSASNASTSATNAANSAAAALASETAASSSASSASTSATNAATSATNSSNSASSASSSASSASTSATNASNSATAAATSATNAANSATAAAQSAQDAADAAASIDTSNFATLTGTQTLTNKTLTSAQLNGETVVSVNTSTPALRITQVGTGNALVVEDSANPDSTPFVVDASGNVGVGTTTPLNPLHVSSAGLNRVRVESTGAFSADVAFYGSGATLYGVVGYSQTKGGLDIDYRVNPLTFSASGAERLRITSAGNVGIGTSAPAVRLHLFQTGSNTQQTIENGTNGLRALTRYAAPTSAGVATTLDVGSFADGGDVQQVIASGELRLRAGGTSALVLATSGNTERMRITAAGNVGIGTTTPATALDVNGTITATNWSGGGIVTATATQTLTNKTAERLVLNDGYTEEVFAITDGATVNLDPNNGSIQTWTLGANRTPGQANWSAGQSITLMINDSASSFTINWTSVPVTWVGGTAPSLAPAGGFTVITLWKVGTTVYGALAGQVA